MEYIIGLIVIVVIGYLIIKYVLPVAGVIAGVIAAAGAVYALVLSIISFVTALRANLDPYENYTDTRPQAQHSRRNYFFGPGIRQLIAIVTDAFRQQWARLGKIRDFHEDFVLVHEWYLNIWVHVFYYSSLVFVYVFGSIWVGAFSLILASVLLLGMTGFFLAFSILWLSDRISLFVRSIQSRCPNCKQRATVPLFVCPQCGTPHERLTPGPYGVFHRRCSCGCALPTTVFNGRSQLEALCLHCQSPLASGGARQFGIQLVGSSGSGKTAFLTAFWHNYLERIAQRGEDGFRLFPVEAFTELEQNFRQGLCYSTSEFNALMYSLIREREGETPLQMTIYDVAGESFTDLDPTTQQQQFKYCEGLIVLVDPTAEPEIAQSCIASMVSEMRKLKGAKTSSLIGVPVAVAISKADLYKREIGLPKILVRTKNTEPLEGEEPGAVYDRVRDELCREFLLDHGFEQVCATLDSEFASYSFFPVSAMGHEMKSGLSYEPWGVEAPVEWLMSRAGLLL